MIEVIYRKESSLGKNDACRLFGLYNGFGFRQPVGVVRKLNTDPEEFKKSCYPTLAAVVSDVDNWLSKQAENPKNESLANVLCFYNEGIRKDTCHYYEDFLKYYKEG